MINVRCFTNLDYYDCSQITQMVCKPDKFDYVSVLYKGNEAWLRVHSVRHEMRISEAIRNETGGFNKTIKEPVLYVELNK